MEQNTKISKPSDIISTVVGAGTQIKGEIRIRNSGRIDGIVEGSVTSDQDVVVGESGRIKGNIKSRRAVIGGKVVGFVNAKEKVVMEDKASLEGDIRTKRLSISDGARFNGNAFMLEENAGSKRL